MVGVTSVRRARTALRYESWHLLHLYGYLGVGLSVRHQIWTGRDFTTSGWARAYRWTSYAIAAGAVVLLRVAMPVRRTMRHGISVTCVVRENHDVVTLRMGARRAAPTGYLHGVVGPLGWPRSTLAVRLGRNPGNLRSTLATPTVTVNNVRAVAALYDTLRDTPPPTRTPTENAASAQTRTQARLAGGLPPLAWDVIDHDQGNPSTNRRIWSTTRPGSTRSPSNMP